MKLAIGLFITIVLVLIWSVFVIWTFSQAFGEVYGWPLVGQTFCLIAPSWFIGRTVAKTMFQ